MDAGRSERIRTFDLLVPNETRYQAALRSEDGAHFTEKVLLHKGLAEKFFCPTSLWGNASEFLDGNHLILVDLRGFAVELFELVEARILIECRGVHGLDLAAIVEGNHAGGRAAGEDNEAEAGEEDGQLPSVHG